MAVSEFKVCVEYQDPMGTYIARVFERTVQGGERGAWGQVATLRVGSLDGRVPPRDQFRMILRALSR